MCRVCTCVCVVNETQVQSSAPASQTDFVPPANHQSSKNDEVAAPSPARASTKHSKKQKNETDKGTQTQKVIRLCSCLFKLDSVLCIYCFPSCVLCLHNQTSLVLYSWVTTSVVPVTLGSEVINLINIRLKCKPLCVHRELPSEAKGTAGQSGWPGVD